MTVLFDYQIFFYQTFGGISRYYYELITQSLTDPTSHFHLNVRYSTNSYISDRRITRHQSFTMGRQLRGINFLLKKWNQAGTRQHLKECDIFHPTYYDDYYLKRIKSTNTPFVLTIYDMINENLPRYFNREGRIPILKRKLAQEADLVLAISDSTKSDIHNEYKIPDEKVIVTHLASSLVSMDSIRVPGIPENYLLYVGRRDTYKNFDRMYNGIKDLLKKEKISLLCAGSDPFSKSELSRFEQDDVEKLILHIPYESDNQLKYLYEHAIAFLFPSLYEGFGIPVIEAFSANCPAILADIPCFREIAGDAAAYFDPYSPGNIAETVTTIVNTPQPADRLRQSGREQLKRYSWKQTYEKTKAAYKTIL